MSALLVSPLLWLALTLLLFEGADVVSRRSGRHPLAHPVLWTTPLLVGLLLLTGTSYATYQQATQSLSFLLGPAVVGLAVPIWHHRRLIRRLAFPILLALGAGALTAIVTSVGTLALFGVPHDLLASIAPRATTTPVAMALASELGGIPAVAALIVLFSGILGAMTATPLFDAIGIRDYRARGFAVGMSAHGIGAARAFQVDGTAGAFASLAMALNAIATSLLLTLWALV
jgi:predicted murein hydrolase (TIGR00659 family)